MLSVSVFVLLMSGLSAVSAHEDDVIADFSSLMHDSSEGLLAKLSEEEQRETLRHILEDVDEDDDDVIEGKELKTWMAETEEQIALTEAVEDVTSLDTDGDTSVSWDEYEAASEDDSAQELEFSKQLFDLADEDDDDELNLAEYLRFSNPEDDDEFRPLLVERVIKLLDENADGKLSYDEAEQIARTKDVFDEDDENSDGFLDIEEIDEIFDDDFEDEELSSLIHKLRAADINADGKMSIEELLDEGHLLQDTPLLTLGMRLSRSSQEKEGKEEL